MVLNHLLRVPAIKDELDDGLLLASFCSARELDERVVYTADLMGEPPNTPPAGNARTSGTPMTAPSSWSRESPRAERPR